MKRAYVWRGAVAAVLGGIALGGIGCGGPDGAKGPSRATAGEIGFGESESFWGHFAADSDFVAGTDGAAIRDSSLWQQSREELQIAIDHFAGQSDAGGRCADAILTRLGRVAVGGPSGAEDRWVLLAEGLAPEDMDACAEAIAHIADENLVIRHEGDYATYRFEDSTWRAAWRGEREAVLSVHEDPAAFRARVAGEDGLRAAAPLARLAGDPGDRGHLWASAIPSEDTPLASALAYIEDFGLPAIASVSVDLDSAEGGVSARVDLGASSAAAAEDMIEALRRLRSLADGAPAPSDLIREAIELEARGESVRVALDLSAEETRELVAAAAASEPGQAQAGERGGAAPAPRPLDAPGGIAEAPAEPPPAPGDLEHLARACSEGDMSACDRLYVESAPGSEEEVYGDTCGGRQPASTGRWCHPEPEGEPSDDSPDIFLDGDELTMEDGEIVVPGGAVDIPDDAADLRDDAHGPVDRATAPAPEEPPAEPAHPELVEACDDGDRDACDVLYAEAAAGSEGEAWGDSCGGRQPVGTDQWCGGSDLEREVVSFATEISRVLAESDDCESAIARGDELAEQHEELVREVREVVAEQSEIEKAAFSARYDFELGLITMWVRKAQRQCGEREDFQDLMERISTEPR